MARPLPAPYRIQSLISSDIIPTIWTGVKLYTKELPSFKLVCKSNKRVLITCARCLNLKHPKKNGIYKCQCGHVSKNTIVLPTI